ncbi:MAG: hypothetical protein QM786_07700 [Breznakibacter sp.]
MIRRDYILRLVADLAEFLAKLLKLSRENLPEAIEQAKQRVCDLYEMSFDEFLNMDDDKLVKPDWPLQTGLADKLGEFLFEMGKMAADQNDFELREKLFLKALYLFQQAELADKSYSFDRIVTIGQIKGMLGTE